MCWLKGSRSYCDWHGIVNIIPQRVSVLRHNAIFRKCHLSNLYFNLKIEHFFVIISGMGYGENVGKHYVKEDSQGQS